MKHVALGGAALLAIAASAHAGFPPGTQFSMETQNFSGPLSPFDATLDFAQFDDQGGTLTLIAVCLDYDLTVSARVTAENDSVLPAPDFAVNLSGFAEVTFAGLSDTTAISTGASFGVGPSDGTPDSGPDFHDFGVLTDNAAGHDDQFFGLGPYIGNGTISAMIHAEAGFSVSGTTDSTIKTTNFMVSGSVTITYKYLPTPGAASLFGIAGLGAMRRRRR
ncbi:MAG: choice-of-anchor E domain-containing protein [Phycisphaerales bacterium]|nr:choice-of-anchor E domain-containing protein [Phycisphaerales bacterium]